MAYVSSVNYRGVLYIPHVAVERNFAACPVPDCAGANTRDYLLKDTGAYKYQPYCGHCGTLRERDTEQLPLCPISSLPGFNYNAVCAALREIDLKDDALKTDFSGFRSVHTHDALHGHTARTAVYLDVGFPDPTPSRCLTGTKGFTLEEQLDEEFLSHKELDRLPREQVLKAMTRLKEEALRVLGKLGVKGLDNATFDWGLSFHAEDTSD